MFQQLQLPDWTTLVGALAFFATFAVFVTVVVHTLRMPRKKIERLENLPWEDDKKP